MADGDDGAQMKTQGCRTWFAQKSHEITQPQDGPHNEELFGFQPSANHSPPPQAPKGTKMAVFKATLLSLPRHSFDIYLQVCIPFLPHILICLYGFGNARLLIGAAESRKDEWMFQKTRRAYWIFDLVSIFAPLESIPRLFQYRLMSPLWTSLYFWICVMQWKWSIVRPAFVGYWIQEFACVYIPHCCFRTLMLWSSCIGGTELCISLLNQYAADPIIAVITQVLCNRQVWIVVRQTCTPWILLLPVHQFLAIGAILLLLNSTVPLVKQGDGLKLMFTIVINPVLNELLGVVSRITARSSRNNHPSTSWGIIGIAVCVKKSFARFVIGSMKNEAMVLVAAIFQSIIEFASRTTMPVRDGSMYRRVFGPYLQPSENPVALMTHVRSRGLRAETERLEATSDFLFLFAAFFWPYLYNATFDNKTTPSVAAGLRKIAVQLALETIMDVCVCLYLATVQNYHLVVNSHIKVKYWSVFLALLFNFTVTWLYIITAPFILCYNPKEVAKGFSFAECGQLSDPV